MVVCSTIFTRCGMLKMEVPAIIGWGVVGLAVTIVTFLVLLSNRIIKKIEKNGYTTLREILKDRNGR